MFYEMEGGIRSSKLEEFKLGSYTIFTPTIRSRNKNNATIISDGINAWIFRLRTDRSLQIEDILNSIEINGQGFQFTYHGNELVDVKLQK